MGNGMSSTMIESIRSTLPKYKRLSEAQDSQTPMFSTIDLQNRTTINVRQKFLNI
jgi:hypothetical protein